MLTFLSRGGWVEEWKQPHRSQTITQVDMGGKELWHNIKLTQSYPVSSCYVYFTNCFDREDKLFYLELEINLFTEWIESEIATHCDSPLLQYNWWVRLKNIFFWLLLRIGWIARTVINGTLEKTSKVREVFKTCALKISAHMHMKVKFGQDWMQPELKLIL